MPDEGGAWQIDLKKLLAASLSQETKRIVQGLMDGSIKLTVPEALEIIRNHIYNQPIKEYLTAVTLRFEQRPTITITDMDDDGKPHYIRAPIDIAESKVYRDELVKHLTLQSTYVWTDIFRSSIEFSAAAAINKVPERSGRRKTTLEELVRRRT